MSGSKNDFLLISVASDEKFEIFNAASTAFDDDLSKAESIHIGSCNVTIKVDLNGMSTSTTIEIQQATETRNVFNEWILPIFFNFN